MAGPLIRHHNINLKTNCCAHNTEIALFSVGSVSLTLHSCWPADNSSNGCLLLHLVQAKSAPLEFDIRTWVLFSSTCYNKHQSSTKHGEICLFFPSSSRLLCLRKFQCTPLDNATTSFEQEIRRAAARC